MKKIYMVDGIDCANCAAKAERGISSIDGVKSARINFITLRMTIECDEDKASEIEEQAFRILKRVEPDVIIKQI